MSAEAQIQVVPANQLDSVLPTALDHLRPILPMGMNAQDPANVRNATLQHEEWLRVDEAVTRVAGERLTVADSLRRRGLVQPLSVGTIIRRTERLKDIGDATISFDGSTTAQRDRPAFASEDIPVPVISFDFGFNWRQLEASRTRGEPLDMTMVELATRKVVKKLQELITNGQSSGGPTGGGIPGITSAANKLTATLTYNWDVNQSEIVAEVNEMLTAAYNSNFFGPFQLQIPKNYWATVQLDYSSQKGDNTFLERLLAFADIDEVVPNDALADDTVALVQMTSDVIQLNEAMRVMAVQWSPNPLTTQFKVMTVAGPHIKSVEIEDAASGSTPKNGIVILS